jgi:hypothetical protein
MRLASVPFLVCSLSLASWGLLGPVSVASADSDLFVADGVFGATVSKYGGDPKWQPSLWLDATYRLAGPLHLGGYFQWLGKDWPLDEPGLGGGGLIALRTNIKKLRLSGAFGGGYLRVPLPGSVEGSGTISAFVGLGYGFLSWMGLEVRGRWMRYFKMPVDAPEQAWSMEAGFSFYID